LNGETKELKNGAFIYEDYRGIVPRGHEFYVKNFKKLTKELDSLFIVTKDIDYLSDKGYVYIIEGRYNEALEIYLKIEQLKPNRYSTASNIGTIYELLGENQKALFWINKAIKINPKSHNGSEWLHAKILYAKIGGAKYIDSDFLINTNFGKAEVPKSNLSKSQREALMKSIYYQLNERVTFIKSEDPIIGILLFELANLALLEKKYEEAKEIYEKARDYGFNSQLLKERVYLADSKIQESLYIKMNKLHKIIKRLQTVNEYNENLFISLLITALIIITILIIVIIRIKKVK
jgi:tetratricopeptide (TPR) repeat protein